MELDDAYFGWKSHGTGKRGRGTEYDPVVVGVGLTSQGHLRYVFLEAVPNLGEMTVKTVLRRRVEERWNSYLYQRCTVDGTYHGRARLQFYLFRRICVLV